MSVDCGSWKVRLNCQFVFLAKPCKMYVGSAPGALRLVPKESQNHLPILMAHGSLCYRILIFRRSEREFMQELV